MILKLHVVLLIATLSIVAAEEFIFEPEDLDEYELATFQEDAIRHVRSIQPGGPTFPAKPNLNGWKVTQGRIKSGGSFRYKRSPEEEKEPNGWKLKPDVFGDQHGNTQTSVGVQHKGDAHTVNAEWNKVVHGPSKAKPTWHVGGSFRFKRSPEEEKEPNGWKVKPDVFGDQHGNTQTSVGVQHKGDAHTVNAEWNKVVHGPSKAKPTWHVGGSFRFKRSPEEEKEPNGWKVKPDVFGDQHGNTQTSVGVQHKGDDHTVNAEWNKVVHGPSKAKPTWHVGGSFRFKRSPEEEKEPNGWKVKPDVFGDQHGNTQTSVGVQHKGDDHTVNAEWNKVVHGPSKAKPTWHVGGSFRFKRSPEEEKEPNGWKVKPDVFGDQNGNTQTSVGVQHKGDDHTVNAEWNKVVHGPSKAKPTWHVGGSFRFKRSPEEEKEPNGWKVKPDVFGDQHGNTQTSVGVQHKGDDHTVNAEWNKVVHGPSKAKPTWHVGGSFRFKRSPEEEKEPNGWKVKPDVFGDQHGNTQTSVGVQHKGDDHTVNAEWNKVVHGPSKAKPTWHVGGSFRFKRSPEDEEFDVDLNQLPIIYQDNVIRHIRSIQPGGPAFPKPKNNGWKVIPGRIKSGGSFRYKRSPEEEKEPNGWKVKPDVFGDQHGNTQTSVGVQHKGDDHTVNAEWNKVVHGPSKAKPSWHVGGSFRF